VAGLLHLDRQPPAVYKGGHDPKVLLEALYTMHRHPARPDASTTEGTVPRQAGPKTTSRAH
jgi:myosin-crossreactive antigen